MQYPGIHFVLSYYAPLLYFIVRPDPHLLELHYSLFNLYQLLVSLYIPSLFSFHLVTNGQIKNTQSGFTFAGSSLPGSIESPTGKMPRIGPLWSGVGAWKGIF